MEILIEKKDVIKYGNGIVDIKSNDGSSVEVRYRIGQRVKPFRLSTLPITREEAIGLIKQIQNGEWDRNTPEPPKGTIAEKVWNEGVFSLGMEYGAIVILMKLFNIAKEDL